MICGYTESASPPVLNIRRQQHSSEHHQPHSSPRSSLTCAGPSSWDVLEESTAGDAPAQDLATKKDNVLQADTCSCALPHPAHTPQGCAAVLQLREFTQKRCCCPVTVPRQHWSWAGTPGSRWAERSWQGSGTALAIPALGAFSWESPAAWHCLCSLGVLGAAHTCTPMCARLLCSLPRALAPHPAPADTPSWPGCSRFLRLRSISLPGSCCKQVLLLWSSDL